MATWNINDLMSDDEYVMADGACPKCRSNDEVNWDGSLDMQGSQVFTKAYCHHCDLHWVEVYNLTGYDILLAENERGE